MRLADDGSYYLYAEYDDFRSLVIAKGKLLWGNFLGILMIVYICFNQTFNGVDSVHLSSKGIYVLAWFDGRYMLARCIGL